MRCEFRIKKVFTTKSGWKWSLERKHTMPGASLPTWELVGKYTNLSMVLKVALKSIKCGVSDVFFINYTI